MDTHAIGTAGEDVAVKYLISQGYKIIERNYRTKDAEIDIIATHKESIPPFGDCEYYVFFEVKYRNSKKYGTPDNFVNMSKQKKIINASKHFLYTNNISFDSYIRFDVISILDTDITHYRNAFEISHF